MTHDVTDPQADGQEVKCRGKPWATPQRALPQVIMGGIADPQASRRYPM